MNGRHEPIGAVSGATRITNLVAASWALLALHLLAQSILITRDWSPLMVLPIPLLAAWATIERKRWGRLTLAGMSLTAITLFIGAIALAAPEYSDGYAVGNYAFVALLHYARTPLHSLIGILIASVTGIWMMRESVIAEFETNKKSGLVVGQHIIAAGLIAFWTVSLVAAPLASMHNTAPSLIIGTGAADSHESLSNRIVRSAQSSRSR